MRSRRDEKPSRTTTSPRRRSAPNQINKIEWSADGQQVAVGIAEFPPADARHTVAEAAIAFLGRGTDAVGGDVLIERPGGFGKMCTRSSISAAIRWMTRRPSA